MSSSSSFDDDHILYEALLHRNDKAYDFLYNRVAGSFANWVYTNNGSVMDAEDAFQKGLLNFLLNVERGSYQLQTKTRITTVVFDYCKKVWLNELQSARMRLHAPLPAFAEEKELGEIQDDLEHTERVNLIRKAMDQLGEECRQLLQWFYLDDLSLREIADKTGLKESSAKAKRYNCAEKMKAHYLRFSNQTGA